MFKGVIFALGACFSWAFIYIIPQFITGFSSMEIALGRYLIYGLLSLLLFCYARMRGRCLFPRAVWIKAIHFALICTIGYYIFLVLALRYATPAICALVLGTSPVTCAIYGNWKQKEISFRKLIVPAAFILGGLVIINYSHFDMNASSYLFGLICSCLALAAWTWYVEANSRFLKNNPEIPSSDWCTLIGIGTLFWVVIFTAVLLCFFPEQLHFEKYCVFDSDLIRFLAGSVILGVLCSWIAEYLWNESSLFLPVSLVGQLTIFETAFAVILTFLIENRLPIYTENIGMAIQFIGIFYGIQQFAKEKNKLEQAKI